MSNLHSIVLAIALLLTQISVVQADARSNFLEAYKNSDYATVAKRVRSNAENGHPFSQNELGRMYAFGVGVRQAFKEAAMWFRKAAEQGFAEGQFNLGNMYANGQGVPQDDTEAVKWYHKAVEQGFAEGGDTGFGKHFIFIER
jgi:TPR repeat protein